MSGPVRAAVAGLGVMGRHHVRLLRAHPDVELVAVVDPAGDAQGVAAGVTVLPELADAIALGLDCCVVAAPTGDHHDLALALVEAGVATLIEKPLASTGPEGRAMVAAFAAAGVPGAVGHIERYNPAVRSLRQRLEAAELGELYQISTSRQGPFPDRIRDVGVVKDLATHDIDLTAWVAGSAYEAVSARTGHRAGRAHEDLVAAVGWLRDGTVTNHLVNWLSPTKERRVTVLGERGCFVADTLTADLTFFANAQVQQDWDAITGFRGVSEGDMVRYAIPKPEPLSVELEQFLRLVQGLPADVVSFEDGLRALEVAEAVLASARDGVVVTVGGPT